MFFLLSIEKTTQYPRTTGFKDIFFLQKREKTKKEKKNSFVVEED